MEVKKINNKQSFASAYACVNGEWVNLTRGGKKVSIKAIRQNVEWHSLDHFIKEYNTDKNGKVHSVPFKEFNAIVKKKFNEYKKVKDSFETILAKANTYVNYHRIVLRKQDVNDIHLILTGKEAYQLSRASGKEKGQFIRNLLNKAKVELGDRHQIEYDIAPERPENVSDGFMKKHGLAWYEATRANYVIKKAKEDAEFCKQQVVTV